MNWFVFIQSSWTVTYIGLGGGLDMSCGWLRQDHFKFEASLGKKGRER